ncbi:unnamed protein product [Clavelina lepadiformis]|uniref:Uncharacterized protein n=1 Tax=Clavelina lepadiformis TaxID=159417 RepID=A0ABP0GQB6_CLALP
MENTAMPSSTSNMSLMQMLNEIVANDQKQQDGFITVAPIAFWTQIFAKYFLHVNNPSHDDLLFYVKRPQNTGDQSEVEVHRRESTRAPGLGDPGYDWTETVYLNLILQQLDYTLTCAICTKVGTKQDVVVHKKVSKQVYASPSRHDMEEKGKAAEMSYPNIFFSIDSFDEVWTDMALNEGEICCVEVVASDKSRAVNSVIFLGSVSYTALIRVYEKRTKNANKWSQIMSLGLLKANNSTEFVRMKGPNGKGYAEMAIKKFEPSKATSSGSLDDEHTCSTVSTPSTSKPCSLPASHSDSALSDASAINEHPSNFHHFKSNLELSAKQTKQTTTPRQKVNGGSLRNEQTLKTDLTYVTLQWHKIILDLLKTFEKPTSAKRPVLHRPFTTR